VEHRLENARPKLLSLRAKAWSMTVEELVTVADSIFRPMDYIVKGSDTILTTMESMNMDDRLIKQTRMLLKKYPEASDTTAEFEMRENSWIPIPGSLNLSASETEPQEQSQEQSPQENLADKRIRSLEKAVKKMGDLMKVIDNRLKALETS